MQMKNIMIKTALAIIAAVLTTGCIFEKMDMPKDLQNVMILLNVTNQDMQTKATPTESESKINSLHIYAFCEGRPAGYMLRQVTEQNTPFLMDLLLPAVVPGGTEAQNTHDVQFYLVANAESMLYENVPISLDESTTQAELEALTFTGIVQNSPLPLYCKQTEAINVADYTSTDAAGHEEHYCLAQKVSFPLSRSFAKISVYGAKPAGLRTSPRILSVEMLAKGTRQYGYIFEQTDDVINAIPSRANNLVLLSTPVSVGELSGSADSPSSYTEVMTRPTYISEVAVGSDSWNVDSGHDNAVVLKIDYVINDGGQTKTAHVYMPKIVRNHHYKVLCLFSEVEEGQIIINLSVADWDKVEVDYTFDYPTHSYLRQSIPTTQAEVAAKPSSEAVMSDTQPFVGYFQMTAPGSDTWIPTLVGAHTDDAVITVYKRNDDNSESNILNSDWPMQAGSNWYKIVVTPKNDFVVGDSVNLAITYTAVGGFTTSEYLLINGSSGEYYWPGSVDANFVTITMTN